MNGLENPAEFRTPTCGRPDREAACARATANERPAVVGMDSSTTVKPFRDAGQDLLFLDLTRTADARRVRKWMAAQSPQTVPEMAAGGAERARK